MPVPLPRPWPMRIDRGQAFVQAEDGRQVFYEGGATCVGIHDYLYESPLPGYLAGDGCHAFLVGGYLKKRGAPETVEIGRRIMDSRGRTLIEDGVREPTVLVPMPKFVFADALITLFQPSTDCFDANKLWPLLNAVAGNAIYTPALMEMMSELPAANDKIAALIYEDAESIRRRSGVFLPALKDFFAGQADRCMDGGVWGVPPGEPVELLWLPAETCAPADHPGDTHINVSCEDTEEAAEFIHEVALEMIMRTEDAFERWHILRGSFEPVRI